MFKFLHTADLHLDSPLVGLARYPGAPAEQLRAATRQALIALVDLAVKEEITFVLIAGDLYDGDWKDYNTGLFFAHQMSRLNKAGIRVYIVAGNHDAASQMTRTLRLPENVTIFPIRRPGTELLNDFGVAIHGQGFPTAVVTADLATGYPPALPHLFNIGMLHTSVTGRPGHETYAPCTLEGLLSRGYQYWALGHVHQREVLHQDPWVVFPGNLQGRHIKETGPKGCALVTVDDGKVEMVEHVDLDVLRWTLKQIDASGAEIAAELVDQAGVSLKKESDHSGGRFLAVRLHITGACKAHEELARNPDYWISEIRAMANDVGNGSIWLEKIVLDTSAAINSEDLLAGSGALGSLLRGLRDLSLDEAQLADLVQEFEQLRLKLPHELRSGTDNLALDRPEYLRDALEEAKKYLLARLLARSGSI
ncbi:MAG: DNA repair exonuclease [Deltaproteobacteria bacterium]|nr:DNA repair exonuclease [Deltaproteobacteria bacterium]